jgi:hypothetical protein
VSNFDRTRCLAGCEEILDHGPGVVGRQWWRVAFIGPLVGFWLKLAEACGRVDGIIETCKIATIIILKIHPRPCGTRINKQTNIVWFKLGLDLGRKNDLIDHSLDRQIFFLIHDSRSMILNLSVSVLYENVFQNPELFPTQVSLSPDQSTLVNTGVMQWYWAKADLSQHAKSDTAAADGLTSSDSIDKKKCE